MSFDCCLTTDNRAVYKSNILELIGVYQTCQSNVVLCFIIVLLLEYLLAYQYIDTTETVHQEQAFRKAQLSNQSISTVQLMRAIRNNIIHSPNKVKPRMLHVFAKMLSDQVIHELTWFYINSSAVQDFLKSLRLSELSNIYRNIEVYKERFGMSDEMFEADVPRLMNVLNAHTIEELNERIIELL